MACGSCGGRRQRAGVVTQQGRQIAGYKLIFPPAAARASVTYSSMSEAAKARAESGIVGSTIDTLYR